MLQTILVILYVSITGLFIESWIVFRKWNSKLHGYLLFNCLANLTNNLGYIMEIKAPNAEVYITALKLSYIGRAWIPFALLMFVTELCKVKVPTAIKAAMALVHAFTFCLVLHCDYTDLYYRELHFSIENGIPTLTHVNGIWHNIYDVLLIAYVVFGMTVLFASLAREKNNTARKRLITVIAAMVSESVFLVLSIFKPFELTKVFDITILGYLVGTLIMFVAIFRYKLLDAEKVTKDYIIDKLSESIIAADNRDSVAYYNKPAGILLPELSTGSSDDVVRRINDAIQKNEPMYINDHIYTPKAENLYIENSFTAKIYVLQDHTEFYNHAKELEEMTERANSANRAKSLFLSNMSHEIRTPINAVLGMDEMILRESSERDIVSYAEDIRTAGRTLLSLINDILDFSKIEEGKMEIIPTRYELSSMINDLLNMVRDRAEKKGLRLDVDIEHEIPNVLYGDEIRIKQCALNILTNAVKYTEKGSVTFSVDHEDRDDGNILLRFRVKDTGIGMKQEDMEKLFSPFSRIEEKRNRNIEGTGLGMSITRQLLSLMGSRLEVSSTYGSGSVFSFSVQQRVEENDPIGDYTARCRYDETRTAYHESFRAPDARILVVDDTPVNLAVIKGLLKRTQLRVDTADSGREALEKASGTAYDLIFIDHMMPEMDGIETLEKLKRIPLNSGTVCVALTANAISGAREMYIEAGFSDYLSKPVDGGQLEHMLMSYLPGDKIVTDSDSAAPGTGTTCDLTEGSAAESGLPPALSQIKGLNTENGLMYCGDEELYLQTLSMFAESARANSDEIKGLLNDGDTEKATIKLHALKSTSRLIGADDLSELARELEAAGKAEDTDTITANIDRLIGRYISLGAALTDALSPEPGGNVF